MTAPQWRSGAWNGVTDPAFTVTGLGRSGVAATHALAAAGANVRVVDEYDMPRVQAVAVRLPADVEVHLGDNPAGSRGLRSGS